MTLLFQILLILHISGGGAGLISGTINLIRKKGDRQHKLFGKIFLGGMLTAGLTSLGLSILHPNYFLFIVGIFTLYMVGTGERYLFLKKLNHGQKPLWIDWLLTAMMLVFGLLFIGFGIYYLTLGVNFGIVLIVFGLVGLNFVRADFINYTGKSRERNNWMLAHIQRMSGTYIASLTAFLVVNIYFLPPVLVWLTPTAIVTPLIIYWSKMYK